MGKKVLYYVHPVFDAGYLDVDLENPQETKEGLFHGIVNEVDTRDGQYLSISKLLIESLDNHSAIRIEPKQLIKFID